MCLELALVAAGELAPVFLWAADQAVVLEWVAVFQWIMVGKVLAGSSQQIEEQVQRLHSH